MTSSLLIVTGTGTGIGKTAIATALVAARAARGGAVAGIKPVESGVQDREGRISVDAAEDVQSLGRVSTFHVTRFPPPYLLASPVSPHLAARREGRTIDLTVVADWVAGIRAEADFVLLELPGGLYSPLSDTKTNGDLAGALRPTRTLLVAPDRLGVIHDVLATTRAAQADGIPLDGVVLSAPEHPDASTGTNAAELDLVLGKQAVLATVPRATLEELTPHAEKILAALGL